MRKRILNVEGYSIEILESTGSGEPLVLFHGNSSAANIFQPLLDSVLGRSRRLIAVSLPGHGGSSAFAPSADSCSIEGLGVLAAKIVAALGYPAFWLLGQSLGGHAIMESIENFTGARGIVLVSAPPMSTPTLAEVFRPDPSDGLLFKGVLTEQEVVKLASCFLQHDNAVNRKIVEDNIRRTDLKFRHALGNGLKGGQLRDELAAIMASSCPIALLAGSEDKFLRNEFYGTLSNSRFWKRQVIWFEGCGHALNLENHPLFEKTIAEFIGAIPMSEQSARVSPELVSLIS